eukprot:s1991_g2.t1
MSKQGITRPMTSRSIPPALGGGVSSSRRNLSGGARIVIGILLPAGSAASRRWILTSRRRPVNPRASVGRPVEEAIGVSLANEDQPQVLQDAGDFLLAWKPPKMSMKRPRGGANSDFEGL